MPSTPSSKLRTKKTELPATAASTVASIAPSSAGEQLSVACLSSESLFCGGNELKIEHNGELYSLRRTRHGKLILTK